MLLFFFPCVRIRIHLCLTYSVLYISKADPRLNTKLSEDMVVHFRREQIYCQSLTVSGSDKAQLAFICPPVARLDSCKCAATVRAA